MENPMVATTKNQKNRAKIQKLQTSKTRVELSMLEPGRALYKTVFDGESDGSHEKSIRQNHKNHFVCPGTL